MEVKKLLDDGKVDSADAREFHIRRSAADPWLAAMSANAFSEFLAHSAWRRDDYGATTPQRFERAVRRVP